MPKLKNPTRKQAEDMLLRTFSIYIRKRDCLKTTGFINKGICCTCGKSFNIEDLQAGHFLSRRYRSIKYDERNVGAQCMRCNGFLNGNYTEYLAFMLKTYGSNVVEELLARRNELTFDKAYYYLELNELFKKKLQELTPDY